MENILQKRINEKYPQENIQVLNYITMKDPARVKCLNCKTEYELTHAENFLKKAKKCICRRCINNRSGNKLDINQFQDRINKKYPQEELQVLNYTIQKEPCSIKCLKCGNTFTLEHAENFLEPSKLRVCKKCLPNKIKYIQSTRKNFLEFINKPDSNFILRDTVEDKHSNDFVKCECKFCHKINQKPMYEYLKGKGCLCLANNRLMSLEGIQKTLPPNFTAIKYEGKLKPMLIKHDLCGFIFKKYWTKSILCPKCDKGTSKGEKAILTFLENNNIIFSQEYTVKINDHNLRFDFYLPDYDLYIEFQGRQHYAPIEYFGGEEQFRKQQEYDNLKREYCKDKLIEIPYTDFNNIDEILFNHLLKSND